MSTELLIENVFLYPVLYQLDHKDYKNIKKKDKVWEIISKEINEPCDALKRKWKNLRDSYMKYLTANKCVTGQEKKAYVAWKWSAEMERFRPFVTNAKTLTNISLPRTTTDLEPPTQVNDETSISDNISLLDEDGVQDGLGQEENENSVHTVLGESAEKSHTRKRKVSALTNTDKVLKFFEGKTKKDMDEIDHMMIGFAKTIKKFSRKRQIIAKKRITDIITELELEEVDDYSLQYSPGASLHSAMVSPSTSFSSRRFSSQESSDGFHGSSPSMSSQPKNVCDAARYGEEDYSMRVLNSFKNF